MKTKCDECGGKLEKARVRKSDWSVCHKCYLNKQNRNSLKRYYKKHE